MLDFIANISEKTEALPPSLLTTEAAAAAAAAPGEAAPEAAAPEAAAPGAAVMAINPQEVRLVL